MPQSTPGWGSLVVYAPQECIRGLDSRLLISASLRAFFSTFYRQGQGYNVYASLLIPGVTELATISVAYAGGARLGLAELSFGA